ncbi:MAG: AAA family ATPase [Proteobacteria bacterium]|nr:AAA family ATPase [Pseudomonadota bacterium]
MDQGTDQGTDQGAEQDSETGRGASAFPSQAVGEIAVAGAPWLQTPCLALHPGLTVIIGARGAGKTALAEMIAAGCDAIPPGVNARSFLHRARAHLKGAEVSVTWTGGETAVRALTPGAAARGPRARYLSQQFVEELCASDGVTSGLLREIERMVFESHGVTERGGAIDFQELLTARAGRHRDARARDAAALTALSARIAAESQKEALAPALAAQIAEKSALVARLSQDRDKLAGHKDSGNVARLTALTHAAERVRTVVRFFTLQEQQLAALKDEVESFRAREAPAALQALQRRYAACGIKGEAWAPFQLDYAGPVERVLAEQIARAQRSVASWRGRPPIGANAPMNPAMELIHPNMDLEKVPLAVLEAEIARLGQRVSLDRQTSEAFTALSRRIVAETDILAQLKERLADAEGAAARLAQLEGERAGAYERIFHGLKAEEEVLSDLYGPIAARIAAAALANDAGSLRKLSFTVRRTVDFPGWVQAGETLLDLRRPGAFAAPGALARAAGPLRDAWESGDPATVSAALADFRETHLDGLIGHAPFTDPASGEYRDWTQRFIAWLTGTDHVALRYTVAYDGVDIRHLSPGTRGIVLLLLYLGFDGDDDRPLIIDQPEENLDPKSVYDELVGLFTAARQRRQVILVTHNANLVVNTDADHVIVAGIGGNTGEGLPPITYRSGGLDDEETRRAVCDILEGGARAFRERARRLGL